MRKALIAASAAVVVATALAACAGSTNDGGTSATPSLSTAAATGTPASSAGGDLIIGRDGEGTTLDNTNTDFENYSIAVFQQIGESLYEASDDGTKIAPLLAADMPTVSADGLSYTVKLRQDVKFSDGTPMTAKDVKFSIDADTAGAGNGGWGFVNAAIDAVSVVDDYTVEFKLKYPWAPFIADLSIFSNAILPNNYAGKTKDEFYQNPIATGPFVFKEWVKGDHATVVKNPNYWQPGKPSLDSITWKTMPDANSRKLALQSGQIHVDISPDWSSWSELSNTPGITATAFPSTEVDMLSMNVQRPPLDDPHVRKAIAYAIDREAIIQAVLYGNGTPANSLLPAGVPYYNPNNPGPTLDLDVAKAEMAKSSIPGGATIELLINSGDANQASIAQILQSELAQIGITVQITQMEATARKDAEFQTNYAMTLSLWTMDIPDPDEWATFAIDPDGGGKSGYTNYNNPAMTALNKQAQQENDPAKRTELYNQIQQQIGEDAANAMLYYVPFGYAYSSKVQNFFVTPLGYVKLKDVTFAP
jgi:peptide/nickel transport system substrate-binding protein